MDLMHVTLVSMIVLLIVNNVFMENVKTVSKDIDLLIINVSHIVEMAT